MQTTRRLATAAARRWFVRELLLRLGPWLSVGLGVGLGLALADRLFGPGLPGWLLVAPPALAGLVMAAAGAWRARRAPVSALGEVDIAMGLRDRLSSAYALSETAPNDPFVAYAADDAERAAGGVRLRQAMPIRLGESWWVWPVLGAMAVATAMFMPAMRIGWDDEAVAAAEEREREVTEASRRLEETREKIEQRLADAYGDPRRDEKLQRLEDIRRQLEEGASDPDTARSSAAGMLDELATEMERDAEDGERRFDALSERFSGLDRPRPDSPASPLADALRRGDERAAREAIEQMQRELELMDEEERRQLAEELERLAERLERESDRAQSERERSRERLLDQGMTQEEAERLLEETDRDAIRDALREQGLDEETAERLADRLADENRRREAEERAEQDARDMAEALRDAAEEMREEEPPPPVPEPEPEPAEPEPTEPEVDPRRPDEPADEPEEDARQEDDVEGVEERPGDDAGEGETGERDPSRTEPSEEPSEDPSEQPSDAPSERPTPDPDGDEGEQREERPEERGEEEPGERTEERGEEGAEEGTEERPEERPEEREGARTEPGEPGERTEEAEREAEAGEEDADAEERPAPGESPGDEASERPGEEGDAEGEGREEGAREGEAEGEPGADGEPGARQDSGRGLDRVRDKIEELERERDRLNRQREDAQGVRDEAQRLMDEMSPEEQERTRRFGEQLARERGDRPDPVARPREREADRVETVDLRRPDQPADDERVIAEWFSDEEAPEGGPVSRRDPGELLREAAEAAERAVEDQPLHPRYRDLIRRYYRRLPELTPPAPAPNGDGG